MLLDYAFLCTKETTRKKKIFEMYEMSHFQCYGLLSDVLSEVSNFHKEKKTS